MLHPNQFHINEAWIAFRLNDAPIHMDSEGDFNCLALMDAASCFILTLATVPANFGEPSEIEARRFLKNGYAHKQEMPKSLFIPNELRVANLVLEAQRQSISILRVPEDQLLIFIGEAKKGFRERFGAGNAQ